MALLVTLCNFNDGGNHSLQIILDLKIILIIGSKFVKDGAEISLP